MFLPAYIKNHFNLLAHFLYFVTAEHQEMVVMSSPFLVLAVKSLNFAIKLTNFFPFKKQLKEAEFGTDMQSVKVEYDKHQKEHKIIDQFQGNVEKCREAEVKFHGEELKIYGERMTVLQKAYNELLVLSNKRVSDLHSLYDFMQVSTKIDDFNVLGLNVGFSRPLMLS